MVTWAARRKSRNVKDGRVVVVIAGLAIIGGGLYLACSAWRRHFLKKLNTGQIRPRTRQVVTWLGRLGGIARGAVFVTAGVFLVIAAIQAQPQQAKGLDSALRALALTPLGPWLLLAVANVLANTDHAYALYWSVPESDWNADYHYFQAFAATFQPAGVNQR